MAAREHWRSRLGFILATTGSAVGLGSIWKFPYEVGANGGGAFILCYLVGLVLIVTPLMLAEFAIGHRGQADATRSIAAVAHEAGAAPGWSAIGILGTVASFLILSFYSVIGGWAIAYAVDAALSGLTADAADGAQQRFDALMAASFKVAAYHALFMGLTAMIVARGIAGGIEAANKVLMPILIALIVLLAAYAAIAGDLGATFRFLFAFDPAKLTPRVALEAIGLGFFSIGVGLAVMVTYAAYAGRGINLTQVAIASIVGDTTISLLAGLAVFPIVFAYKLDPAGGPGLVFVTLPIAFARMPVGGLVALAFFVLLAVAALASAISLLEMPVALLRRLAGWSRGRASFVTAAVCWLCGLATVLSFSLWANWHPLAGIPAFAKSSVFDLLDYLTSNIMLPVGGFVLALFAGWSVPRKLLGDELTLGATGLRWLVVLLRYAVPAGIAAVTLGHFFV
jgi:NSS family neurotransmitter:Na+ symporter